MLGKPFTGTTIAGIDSFTFIFHLTLANFPATNTCMKAPKNLLCVIVVLLLVGCRSNMATIDYSSGIATKAPDLQLPPHEKRKADDIEVVDVSTISHQFVVVGIAEAETTSLVKAVILLRKEAAALDGDAIIDIMPSASGGSNVGLPVLGDLSFRSGRVWTTRVIRWIPSDMKMTATQNKPHEN